MDIRDLESASGVWYESFSQPEMTITFSCMDEEGDEVEVEVPARYEVCGLCNGKGSHVNPAIDSNGLTEEDFAEDPDFRESYLSGAYDVACYRCKGLRVSPVVDEARCSPEQLEMVRKRIASHEEYRRCLAREARYGY